MKYYHAGSCDIAVIGAGHAGIEAALAAARLGLHNILFTINLDAVGNMPTPPSAAQARATWSGSWTLWAGKWVLLPTRPASSTGCSTVEKAPLSTPSGPRRTAGLISR